jgi:outer membrane protein assembly factor BamB
LKRLARDLRVIIFTSRRGKRYTAFAYSNGTWFQLVGRTGDDPATVHWNFTHCEPYLRRTFHGTTEDLLQIIVAGLANRKKPPEPDPNEPPGLGPEIQSDKHSRGLRSCSGSLFAVIPTFVIVGPLGLLAALFPAVFGGLALVMRRWLVLLTIASLNSTLYLGHWWLHGSIKESWWGTPAALWCSMVLVTLAGIYWSWYRRPSLQRTAGDPRCSECILLGSLSLIGLAVVAWCIRQGTLSNPPWKDLLAIWAVAWVGTLHAVGIRLARNKHLAVPALPSAEGIMLCTLFLACAGIAATSVSRPLQADGIRLVWAFEPKDRGAIISSPVVNEDRVYVAAIQGSGFSTCGVVYCLNQESGEEIWRFDDDGAMQQMFSSPYLADGRLYIGEGLHENRDCKLYCLDAASGRKLWQFAIASHIESSPCVVGGRVYVGGGEDGIYCLDASTGAEHWHFQENVHVDASPTAVGKYLYAGSGVSRSQKKTQVFCLDTEGGRVLWRHAVKLPVWGSPCVSGNRIFFGLGNGRYDRSGERPAGALLCVDAQTGKELWCHEVDDAVLMAPPRLMIPFISVRGIGTVTASGRTTAGCGGRPTWGARWWHTLSLGTAASTCWPVRARFAAWMALPASRSGPSTSPSRRRAELRCSHPLQAGWREISRTICTWARHYTIPSAAGRCSTAWKKAPHAKIAKGAKMRFADPALACFLPMIRTFEQIRPDDRDAVGGKGLSLGLLTAAGLPVPPGFCVTSTAYRRLHPRSPHSDLALRDQIREAYHRLGCGLVAVRSSATTEDGTLTSGAGQQETILGAEGEAAIMDAVARCWASLDSARAIAYRQRQGIQDNDLAMAVVVQRLVPAEVAGVLFTRDPLDPEGKCMLVEASWGLGESVVSGYVSPDRFHLDRQTGTVLDRQISTKTTLRTATGREAVASDQQNRSCLDEAQLVLLAQLGRFVEAVYGHACDVEWAWVDGGFWHLQARPITADGAAEREQVRREEIDALKAKADPRGTVWSRYNLSETLPEPTPIPGPSFAASCPERAAWG